MGRTLRRLPWLLLAGVLLLWPVIPSSAGQQDNSQPDQQTDQDQAKKASKAKQKSEKDLYKELNSQYKKWLDEDVVYIIQPEERRTFCTWQRTRSANNS